MPSLMHAFGVGTFIPMLQSLSGLLDRGAEHADQHGIDLVDARLAPDMFNLAQQVRRACYYAVDAANRLRGQSPAVLEEEEKTFSGLKSQVFRTLQAMEAGSLGDFDNAEKQDCTFSVESQNLTIKMDGLDFLRAWILPHFYFHVVTAYDILRHHGVELGMKDLLMPSVGPFIHPDPAPPS